MATQRQVIAWHKLRQVALSEYVRLASAVPGVACISLVDDFDPDIFTYIDGRDMDVLDKLFDIEDAVYKLVERQFFDYHVVYLEGRPLKQWLDARGKTLYERADAN